MALSVECRTCDQEVVGSSLGRARGVKTLGMFLTPMCLCSPSSTSWYRPKGGDALRLGSKRQVWFVCGWQVKLCDPLVTQGPYLSALEVRHDEALYKSTFTLLYFTGPASSQRPTRLMCGIDGVVVQPAGNGALGGIDQSVVRPTA